MPLPTIHQTKRRQSMNNMDNDCMLDREDWEQVMRQTGSMVTIAVEAAGNDRIEIIGVQIRALLELLPIVKKECRVALSVSSPSRSDISMEELSALTDHIEEMLGDNINLTFGICNDEVLGNVLRVELGVPVEVGE